MSASSKGTRTEYERRYSATHGPHTYPFVFLLSLVGLLQSGSRRFNTAVDKSYASFFLPFVQGEWARGLQNVKALTFNHQLTSTIELAWAPKVSNPKIIP